jgi:capsular exopolysaccharide synthesis family protein
MIRINENGRGASAKGERRLGLAEIASAARRRPLLAAGLPTVLLASTGFFLWWAEPTYDAAATVRVDQDRSGVAIIEALQTLSSGSKISTEMEELRSRSLAEEVVDSLSLQVTVVRPRKVARSALFTSIAAARTAPPGRYTIRPVGDGRFSVSDGMRDWTVRAGESMHVPGLRFTLAPAAASHDRIVLDVEPFQEAVRDYLRAASVSRPNREADIIRIRYEGRDRDIVRDVPNIAAQRFIERRNRVRTREARSTAEFLEQQIASLAAQLGTAEDELREYREQFGVVALEAEGQAQVSRLADMQAEREMLGVERNALLEVMSSMEEASPRGDAAASPYRALLGFPTMLRSIAASDLLRSLHEIEAERAKFLDRRTMQDPEVRVLTEQIRAIDAQLHGMATTYLAGVTAQIQHLDRTLAGFTAQLQQIPEKELRLARLRRQTAVGEELYSQLQLRLKEAEIMAAVDDPSVRVVDPSIVPRRPIRPDVPLTVGLALLFGMVLGVGGAVAREQLDNTVRTRDELQLLAGAPVLGSIPRIDAPLPGDENGDRRERRRRTSDRVAARLAEDIAGSPVIEAYRSLRTNINFSQIEQRPRILVITSPAPGDGKSTTAANLAATMTRQGLRCLLVDADLRRGMLHDVLGVPREPGLSNVLMSERTLAEAVRKLEELPDFLATGTLPPNPAELLGSARMAEILKAALTDYDTILLDAPPMNLVTDAAVLARSADGVLVVARAGVTPRQAILYTFDQLTSVRARILGSVLNDADVRRESHYGSYMKSYYHTDS